jgi:hypothetical protein
MRRNSNSFFALMMISVIFFSGCATSSLYMDVLVPGQISVPQEVQSLGVINRSLPAKQNLALNILEGFITGESIMGDRESSEHCVRGFSMKINDGPRFKAMLLEGLELKGTGTREWPVPINWTQVESLCKQYGVDALVVLETYDSNTGIRQWEETKKRKKDGQEITYKEYNAHLVVNMYSGWRIYFPATKRILDQNSYMDEKGWRTSGENPDGAMRKLPPKRRALNDAGTYAGMQYAVRISPSWVKVQREYYVKGHKYFETTKPMVKQSNWKEAVGFWKTLAENKDSKIAGRACYNMALASEMDGNLELALQWAEIAWKKHGLKKAQHYINTLTTRIMHQQRLKEQMQGE